MLKYINAGQKNFNLKLESILEKRRLPESKNLLIVKKIINDVKKKKDKAVLKYEKKFLKLKKIKTKDIKFLDIATSIAAFIRAEFKIKNTRLNNFVKRKEELTKNELRGGLIFYGKGNCISCHSGPNFTNQRFYTVAFPQLGFGKEIHQ